jgi:NTP pyrophosphatase (non-canonical NTP hydrolase)
MPRYDFTFATLRLANTKRLPTFKNAKGEPAHSQPDGSDWSNAQWLGAVLGELGEFANLEKKVVRGDLTMEQAKPALAKELADVVTYLDILAYRLDIDLGEATRAKFNEVSARVGSPVTICEIEDRVVDPRPVFVYSVTDDEWWAGQSREEVVAAVRAEYGHHDFDDYIELVSPQEMLRLQFRSGDGTVRPFIDELHRSVERGDTFPCYFAGPV